MLTRLKSAIKAFLNPELLATKAIDVPVDPEKHKIPLIFPLGHFYSPVADPVDITQRQEKIWAKTDCLVGVDMNVNFQLSLLKDLKSYVDKIHYPEQQPSNDPSQYFYSNDQFPCLDAEFLFTALCHFKPQRVIEIGSGFSSLITADVNRQQLIERMKFTCIEPYPRQFLLDGVEGINELKVEKVENVERSFFDCLESGDVLFIDSSHVSKVGSDVNYLFFEIIPRLKVGVLVHIHDIFLPDEYPVKWVVEEGRNWNEQYLLRSFLQFNDCFEIVWAANFMGSRFEKEVIETFPRCKVLGMGGSMWIRRVK